MGGGAFKKVHIVFDSWFERFRLAYLDVASLGHPPSRQVLAGAALFVLGLPCALSQSIGEDFFPRVDGGQVPAARPRARRHAGRGD